MPNSFCTTLRNSGALIAAVPNFPTTILAARLANAVAWGNSSPAAREAASTEITVSPAPVTSNTSRALAGKCNACSPERNKVIPCSPRVTNKAPISSSLIKSSPFVTSSFSSAHTPTTASNSLRLGVIRLAPR